MNIPGEDDVDTIPVGDATETQPGDLPADVLAQFVPPPRYLGDGVYVTAVGGMLQLTAGHHLSARATNVVFLEQWVFEALQRYAAEVWP